MKTFPNSCQMVCKWFTTKIPFFICEVTLKKPFENKPIRADSSPFSLGSLGLPAAISECIFILLNVIECLFRPSQSKARTHKRKINHTKKMETQVLVLLEFFLRVFDIGLTCAPADVGTGKRQKAKNRLKTVNVDL